MLTIKLALLLGLLHSSSSNLPEECLPSGPGPPVNRTRVMLGYLTDVTGMPGRQVRLADLGLLRDQTVPCQITPPHTPDNDLPSVQLSWLSNTN